MTVNMPRTDKWYMERNVTFKRKASLCHFRVVFINRSLGLLDTYLVSVVIIECYIKL